MKRVSALYALMLLVHASPSTARVQDMARAKQHAEKGVKYAQAGDLVRAEAELRRAVELAPSDAAYLTSLGGILAVEQKLEEANAFFEKAIKANPEDPVSRRNLAANQWQLGQLKPAQANLERLLRSQPADKVATLLLGMVSENLGDYPRAAKLLASVPEMVDQRPESVAALANSYYHTAQNEKAHELLEKLSGRGGEPQGIFTAARIAAEAKDYSIAEKLFESIHSNYPDATTLGYNLALIQYRTNRVAESQRTLLDLVGGGGVTSDIYNLLGWCYHKQGSTTEAIRALEKAIRADPSKESNYLDLSMILITTKKLAAGLEVASRMVNDFPRSEPAYRIKGLVQMKMDQFTDAVHSYSRAVELDPASLDSKVGLASARWAAGMHAQSETEFQRLIKQYPREAVIYETFGTLLLDSATDDAMESRAVALLKTAVALDGARAEPHFQLGNLVLKKGKTDATPEQLRVALDHLEIAARLEPAQSKIHYALARMYRRLGHAEEASREMQHYQELKAEEDRANPRQTALGMQVK